MAGNNFEIDIKAFGIRLNQMRRIHDVKQTTLADYLGLTRSRVSSAEGGKNAPGLTMLRGVKTYFSQEHGDAKTYDWWIDGVAFDASKFKKEDPNAITMLQSIITDKEKMIALLEEKIASLTLQLASVKT